MKLRQARVRNFRSIVDSGTVDIEEGVTVLIGKNEQGKTTFQKALLSLNQNVRYREKDFPNHLRNKLEKMANHEIPMVDAWFLFEPMDSEWTQSIPELKDAEGVKVTKSYDDQYTYAAIKNGVDVQMRPPQPDVGPIESEVHAELGSLRGKLAEHAARLSGFAPSLDQANIHITAVEQARFDDPEQLPNLIKTFATGMKALSGQDAAVQADVTATVELLNKRVKAIQALFASDPYAAILQAMPKFVFHSTGTDQIPDFVSIPEFVADPEGTSRGMANLCAVAGLATQKLKELSETIEAADRETFEDDYRTTVSGGINEYWTQEKYSVHFRIEASRLSVSISDGSYTQRIAPSARSDGFQWYLSFFAALLSEVGSAPRSMVLLLDNPGLELHADGQRDIKRFLDEKLPAQIVYVTHSPAMIDVYNLEQVRQVELQPGNKGTKIKRLKTKSGFELDSLEPVRSAIGASIATSLIFNDFNLLAEGAADKPIIEGALRRLRPDDYKSIVVTGSISESGGLLAKFYQRANLPLAAFVDGDSSGRELKKQLLAAGLDSSQIVDLAAVMRDRKGDFELEDIISREFYHLAVAETYPSTPVDHPPDTWKGKRTKYYEEEYKKQHNIGFSKRRVAETLKRLLIDGSPDKATLEALDKLTTALWEALNARRPKRTGAKEASPPVATATPS